PQPTGAESTGNSTSQTRPLPAFGNHTLRQIVHTSIGGDRARVVFGNVFGTVPLVIGSAHIALRDKEGGIASGSGRPLQFSGRATVTIPPGAVMVSDPVALTVPPLADLAIDLYLPESPASTSPLTAHNGSRQTNYLSTPGNHGGETALSVE